MSCFSLFWFRFLHYFYFFLRVQFVTWHWSTLRSSHSVNSWKPHGSNRVGPQWYLSPLVGIKRGIQCTCSFSKWARVRPRPAIVQTRALPGRATKSPSPTQAREELFYSALPAGRAVLSDRPQPVQCSRLHCCGSFTLSWWFHYFI